MSPASWTTPRIQTREKFPILTIPGGFEGVYQLVDAAAKACSPLSAATINCHKERYGIHIYRIRGHEYLLTGCCRAQRGVKGMREQKPDVKPMQKRQIYLQRRSIQDSSLFNLVERLFDSGVRFFIVSL